MTDLVEENAPDLEEVEMEETPVLFKIHPDAYDHVHNRMASEDGSDSSVYQARMAYWDDDGHFTLIDSDKGIHCALCVAVILCGDVDSLPVLEDQ